MSVYNDVAHDGYTRGKNSGGSVPHSGAATRNQNSRLANNQGAGAGLSETMQGEDILPANQIETRNSKTLYTNISLRELSSSPDRRAGATQNIEQPKFSNTSAAAPKSRIYQNT